MEAGEGLEERAEEIRGRIRGGVREPKDGEAILRRRENDSDENLPAR